MAAQVAEAITIAQKLAQKRSPINVLRGSTQKTYCGAVRKSIKDNMGGAFFVTLMMPANDPKQYNYLYIYIYIYIHLYI